MMEEDKELFSEIQTLLESNFKEEDQIFCSDSNLSDFCPPDFGGAKLVVAYEDYFPHLMVDENGGKAGLYGDILTIAENHFNVSFVMRKSVDGQWGTMVILIVSPVWAKILHCLLICSCQMAPTMGWLA